MTERIRYRWSHQCKRYGKVDVHEAEDRVWVMINQNLVTLELSEAFEYAKAITTAASLVEKRLAEEHEAARGASDNPAGQLLMLPAGKGAEGEVT